MIHYRSFFGYKLGSGSYDDVLDQFKHWLLNPKFRFVVTMNPEIFMTAARQPTVRDFIKQASVVFADGVGIWWASQLMGTPVTRITGIELTHQLLKSGQFSIYIVGGRREILSRALDQIRVKYPAVSILGTHHGFFMPDQADVILSDIVEKRPDIVLVGLGSPRQDLFLAELAQKATHGIGIGIGGVLDVISGEIQRAPKLFSKIGLEWVWRGIQDPKRITRWRIILPFIFNMLHHRFFHRRRIN